MKISFEDMAKEKKIDFELEVVDEEKKIFSAVLDIGGKNLKLKNIPGKRIEGDKISDEEFDKHTAKEIANARVITLIQPLINFIITATPFGLVVEGSLSDEEAL